MQRRVHSFTFVIQLFLGLPRQHPSSAEPWRTVLENIRKKSPTDEHGGVVVMESFFFMIFSRKTLNSRFTIGQAWRMPTVVRKRSHNWLFIRTEVREPLDSTSMVRARPSFMLNSAPQAKTPLARPCQKSFWNRWSCGRALYRAAGAFQSECVCWRYVCALAWSEAGFLFHSSASQ